MCSTFDINRFPYPIAQTYGYIPTTERQIQRTGGVGTAIHKTIICFETVCRFCVWEMVMEYAILEEKNQKLTDFLSQNLFFSKQGISLGSWVSLLMMMAKFLKNRQSKLFMPEMPLLFYREKGKKISPITNDAIKPFVRSRTRFAHAESSLSPDMYSQYFSNMHQMLMDILTHMSFLDQYCLMAVTKLENRTIREGILLEGPARDGANQFNEYVGCIQLRESQSILPDTVVLIHRSALETCEAQPFLCYPIFLFSAFKSIRDRDNERESPPDELYVMNQVKHEQQDIHSLSFIGHLQNCRPKECSPKTQDPDSERTLQQFCDIITRIGITATTECQISNAISPFDESQENEIAEKLTLYVERMEAKKNINDFLESDARCLVMTGKPGAGKSAFAASLINDLRTNESSVGLFHLIRPTRRNWKIMVASLMQQIQHQFGKKLKPAIKIPNELLDDEVIIKLYREALSRLNALLRQEKKKLLVVIDALDELAANPDDLTIKNIFSFVPPDLVFDQIKFFITSRQGLVINAFVDHLASAGRKTEAYELAPMNSDEILSLCRLNGIDSSSKTIAGLLSATEGNPLYLKSLLTRIRLEPGFNLNHLPSEVVDFFRVDLKRRFQIDQDELLRNLLALFLVLKEGPNATQLAGILKTGRREILKKLYQLSGYLTFDPVSETYTPFHLKFCESLTWGNDPILYPEDLIEAHRKVAAWCEPMEEFQYSETPERRGSRAYYALNYLARHYWAIGPDENYQGFLNLLARNNVTCELACRMFLKDLIASQANGQLMDDPEFQRLFKNLFWKGNDAARHAILRLNGDIEGYIFPQQARTLWEEIIKQFDPTDYWYHEIYRVTSVFYFDRLNKSMDFINHIDSLPSLSHIRACYLDIGLCFCNVDYSNFNPELGLDYFRKSGKLLEATTIDDMLAIFCNDRRYAQFGLNRIKQSYYNVLALTFRRIGKIDEATLHYERALAILRQSLAMESIPFLKNKFLRSGGSVQHNLGYLKNLLGDYNNSFLLFCQVMQIRVRNRTHITFCGSLNITKFLFQNLDLMDFYLFTGYFSAATQKPEVTRSLILKTERLLDYFRRISDFTSAEKELEKLKDLRSKKENFSYIDEFSNVHDEARLAMSCNDGPRSIDQLKIALAILKEKGEWQTISVSDKNYFHFWYDAAQIYLLNHLPEKSCDIITNTLTPWFEKYRYNGLLPQFYDLQSRYYEYIGDSVLSRQFQDQRQQELKAGWRSIATLHFPEEVMDYLDIIVDGSEDNVLKGLYNKVRNRLASGLIPKMDLTDCN